MEWRVTAHHGANGYRRWTITLEPDVLVSVSQSIQMAHAAPFYVGFQVFGYSVLHGVELKATNDKDARAEALSHVRVMLTRWNILANRAWNETTK